MADKYNHSPQRLEGHKASECKHHPGGKRSLCPLTMSYCDADGRPCQWGKAK